MLMLMRMLTRILPPYDTLRSNRLREFCALCEELLVGARAEEG